MIHISGSAHRSFIFPADLPTAYAYYSDLGYILNFLPQIYITRTYAEQEFRVCYTSTELGAYQVDIFCDLRAELDDEAPALRLGPLNGMTPANAKAGFRSTSASGYFASQSLFFAAPNGETRIEYRLELKAQLPTPKALQFMPAVVVDSIAGSITHRRIAEIAEGFIKRSINAFPDWVGELGQD